MQLSLLVGCAKNGSQTSAKKFEPVVISQLPDSTVFLADAALELVNGVYHYRNEPYSGLLIERYEAGSVKSRGAYFHGRQHGPTKTYFPSGKVASERNYRNGVGYGRHVGFWENGHRKFDFLYDDDKREGVQRQWYENGQPYCALTYAADRESGMQQAWLQNGKPYINYEVRDGVRYGLQKSALCYTLTNGKLP